MGGHFRRNHSDDEFICPVPLCGYSDDLKYRQTHLMSHTKAELIKAIPIRTATQPKLVRVK